MRLMISIKFDKERELNNMANIYELKSSYLQLQNAIENGEEEFNKHIGKQLKMQYN